MQSELQSLMITEQIFVSTEPDKKQIFVGDNDADELRKIMAILRRKFKELLKYFTNLVPAKMRESPDGISWDETNKFLHIQNELIRNTCLRALEKNIFSFEKKILASIVMHFKEMLFEYIASNTDHDWQELFASLRNTLIVYEQKTRVHRELARKGHILESINSFDYSYTSLSYVVFDLLELLRKKSAARQYLTLDHVETYMEPYIHQLGEESANQLNEMIYFTEEVFHATKSSDLRELSAQLVKSIQRASCTVSQFRTYRKNIENAITNESSQIKKNLKRTIGSNVITPEHILRIQIAYDGLITFMNLAYRQHFMKIAMCM